MPSRVMTSTADIQRFLLAGHATLTLKSLRTGAHYTYKVTQAEDDEGRPAPRWFVKVLCDGDQYVYLGMIMGTTYRLTAASKFGPTSGAHQAFLYFFTHLPRSIPPQLEVRHEGRCGRCGRELTHPDSIDRGIGPDCWEMMSG